MDGQLVTLGAAPAHIVRGEGLRLNAAAQAGIQASFAVLKIRSKVFRIRYRGEERILQDSPGTGRDGRPLPVAPVPTLDVIVVGINQAISKRFYVGGFVENAEGRAPDCFSINGVAPDAASAQKQAPACATCPKNIWGSATTEDGRKAKACDDRRRIAVVPAYDVANELDGGPMLLDIPPASLKVLDAYTRFLDRQGADASQVITRIGFNPEKTLELTFDYVDWVKDGQAYDTAIEMGKTDQVRRMLFEELVEVTADASPERPMIGERPTHIPPRQAPAQLVANDPPAEPDEPVGAPVAPTPTPPRGGPTPFSSGRAAVAANVAAPAEPAPAKERSWPITPERTAANKAFAEEQAAKAAANPTIVQGAPASLEAEIDNLLSGC